VGFAVGGEKTRGIGKFGSGRRVAMRQAHDLKVLFCTESLRSATMGWNANKKKDRRGNTLGMKLNKRSSGPRAH